MIRLLSNSALPYTQHCTQSALCSDCLLALSTTPLITNDTRLQFCSPFLHHLPFQTTSLRVAPLLLRMKGMLPFLFFSPASELILLLKKDFFLPPRSFHCVCVCVCVCVRARTVSYLHVKFKVCRQYSLNRPRPISFSYMNKVGAWE